MVPETVSIATIERVYIQTPLVRMHHEIEVCSNLLETLLDVL